MNDNELLLRVRAEIDDKISGEMARINKLTEEMNKAFRNADSSVKNFEAKTNKSMKSVSGSFKSLNLTAALSFAALSAGFTKAVKSAADFEYSINKVQTVSNESFASIKKDAEEMSLKYGVAVTEVTEGNYQLVSAMGDTANKSLIMNRNMMLAKAGFTSFAGAIDLTTSVMNAYNMQGSEINKVTDILIQTQNKGKTTIDNLRTQMGRVLPTASSLKVSFEEVAASYAFLTAKGQSTELATTSLDAALRELGNSGSEVHKTFFRITGQTFPDFIAGGGTLAEALKKIGDEAESQGLRIEDMFSSAESKRLPGLFYGNQGDYAQKIKEIQQSNGVLEISTRRMTSNARASFERLGQSIEAVVRQLGEDLAPEAEKASNWLSKPDNVKTAAKWTEIAIAIGAAAFALKTLHGIMNAGIGIAKNFHSAWSFGAEKQKEFAEFLNKVGNVKVTKNTRAAYDIYEKMMKETYSNPDYIGDGSTGVDLRIWKEAQEAAAKAGKSSGKNFMSNLASSIKDQVKNLVVGLEMYFQKFGDKMGAVFGAAFVQKMQGIITSRLTLAGIGFLLNSETVQAPEEAPGQPDSKFNLKKRLESEKFAPKVQAVKNDLSEIEQYTIDTLNKIEYAPYKIWQETETAKQKTSQFQAAFKNLYKDVPELAEAMGLDNMGVLKEKLGRVTSLIAQAIEDGNNMYDPETFRKLINERITLEGQIEKQEKADDAAEKYRREAEELQAFVEFSNRQLQTLPRLAELLGLDEDSALEEKADFYASTLSEMIEKGFDKKKPELFAKLKLKWDEVKKRQDVKYDEKQKQDQREKDIEKQIADEVKAYQDTIKHLNSIGDSLYKVGDALENDFVKAVSGVVNSMSALIESLAGSDGKGGLLGNLGSLAGGADKFSFSSLGTLSGMASGLGVAGAAMGVLQSLEGMGLFGKDKSKQIEAKNQENLKRFEENTNAIKELTDKIKANTETLRGLTDTLITNLSKNPTLANLYRGQTASGKLLSAIEANRNFSSLTAIEKGSKKTGPWYNKKKVDTYTEIGISDAELLKAAGIGKNSIESLTFEELKKFNTAMQSWDLNTLKSITGKNLTESNIGEIKDQINEYIKQVELLQKEQEDLFRAATFESFKGIEYLDTKALKQQYIQMYEDMGLDVSQYIDLIDELVEANATLITAMQGVREEIVAGTKTFSQAMDSYFSDILHNASSTLYDVMFSQLDAYFSDAFKDISERLVELKKAGKKITPEELFKNFDWSKLVQGDKLQQEMKKQIDEIKDYLIDMGVSVDLVESMFGDGKFEKLKEYLTTAMNAALDSGNFSDFSKSLGQSLYENVKQSLIKAFTETKLYKSLIDKFMPDFESAINGAGSFEEAFDIIQKYLKDFEHKLQGSGLGFDIVGADDAISKNDASLGGYYTEDKPEIRIEIIQNFDGQFYGENAMLEYAKKGTKEALEEIKTNGQILASF